MKVFSKSGLLRTGVDVNMFFKAMNALSHSSVHTAVSGYFFFLVRLVSGTAMDGSIIFDETSIVSSL